MTAPWHFLYFWPLPQGQGSFRPTRISGAFSILVPPARILSCIEESGLTLYLVVLLSVLSSVAQRGSKVTVSLYVLELGAGSLAVGVLAALFATFPLLLAVHAGRISDRFGVRYPMLLGGAAMAIALGVPAI